MRYCKGCGELIEIESKFCPSCGVKQSSDNLNKSNQTYPEPNSESVLENVEDIFGLDDKKIIDVSLLDEDLLLDIISNAYKGVEFEYIKYALMESFTRQIKLNKTLERRINSNYEGLLTEQLISYYKAKKDNLLNLIKAKIIFLDEDKVIDIASANDDELIEELAKMGNNPSFYRAKYTLLEMLCRDMNEFTKVSSQVIHIEYISELKPKYDKIKRENELAIDLKKTNKRLDKYEKADLGRLDTVEIIENEVYDYDEEPQPSFYEKNNSNLIFLSIVAVIVILGYLLFFKKGDSSSYSDEQTPSQTVVTENPVDICRCLTEAGDSPYMRENGKACDNAISSTLNVPNWRTVNFSQNPYLNAKFEELARGCVGK